MALTNSSTHVFSKTDRMRSGWTTVLSLVVVMLSIGLGTHKARASCPADWDASGRVSVQDIFGFLSAWFGGVADYNRDGSSSVQDIFDFLQDWFVSGDAECVGSVPVAYFNREYIEPMLDELSVVTGVRMYSGDVLLLVPRASDGILELRLWNSDSQRLSGVLAEASSYFGQSGRSRLARFADIEASQVELATMLEVVNGPRSMILAGVGVNISWGCEGGVQASVFGVRPLLKVANIEDGFELLRWSAPDYASGRVIVSQSTICGSASGLGKAVLADIGRYASGLGSVAFEAAVVRRLGDPSLASSILGIGEWVNGDTSLAGTLGEGLHALVKFSASSHSGDVVANAVVVTSNRVGEPRTELTGWLDPVTSLAETITVTQLRLIVMCSMPGTDGMYAVIDGFEVQASTAPECVVWCGEPRAAFSTQEAAEQYLAITDPRSIRAVDLPPAWQFDDEYVVEPLPRDQWPVEGSTPGPDGQLDTEWNAAMLSCWKAFQRDLRDAIVTRAEAESLCTHWNGGIRDGCAVGVPVGAAIGAGVSVCGIITIPTLPATIAIGGGIGACIGGVGGSLMTYSQCLTNAKNAYNIDRDQAIRRYLDCLCDAGVCVPGL